MYNQIKIIENTMCINNSNQNGKFFSENKYVRNV